MYADLKFLYYYCIKSCRFWLANQEQAFVSDFFTSHFCTLEKIVHPHLAFSFRHVLKLCSFLSYRIRLRQTFSKLSLGKHSSFLFRFFAASVEFKCI